MVFNDQSYACKSFVEMITHLKSNNPTAFRVNNDFCNKYFEVVK